MAMRKPYLIESDGVGFKWLNLQIDDIIDLMPETYSDAELLRFSYYNTRLKDGWNGVASRFAAESNDDLPIPDISLWLPGAALVLSSRAMEVLESVLQDSGEFLPVMCEGQIFHIFNCLRIISADPLQSEHHIESGIPVGIKAIVFSQSDVDAAPIFKTLFDYCSTLYCNENFKTAVETAGLRGISFSTNLCPEV